MYPVTPVLADAVHAIVAVVLVDAVSVGVPGAAGTLAAAIVLTGWLPTTVPAVPTALAVTVAVLPAVVEAV
jgi:hypothetical protein